jgi:pyruvate,water dikinase
MTILGVKDEIALIDAVLKVYASLWGERVIGYLATQSESRPSFPMPVMVQVMIDTVKSGVAFSVDITKGDWSNVLINAGYGLPESIVQGSQNGDRYVVNKFTNNIVNMTEVGPGRSRWRKDCGQRRCSAMNRSWP